MAYLKTAQLAKAVGVHVNTVRLYVEWGYLPSVSRAANGYRMFTQRHLEHLKLARIALRCNFCAGDIRKSAIGIIKSSVSVSIEKAQDHARGHLGLIRTQRTGAEEALELAREWIEQNGFRETGGRKRTTKQAAQLLDVTIDTLRTWELNGLIRVPRNSRNGYREYGKTEIKRLKIIRTLRHANYSIMAILRMMSRIGEVPGEELRRIIDTPDPQEDIVYATDKWITSLEEAESNAHEIIRQLQHMSSLK